jgi:hypothetical protein
MAQLEQSDILRPEVEHFRRQPLSHVDRTYEFLRGSIDRHLGRTRERHNRDAKVRALEGKSKPGVQANPAQEVGDDAQEEPTSESGEGNGKGDKSSLSKEEKEKKAREHDNNIECLPIDPVSEG